MNYNHKRTAAGQVMPLLMGCTKPESIEADLLEEKIIYDPMTQKVVMDMRVIGTKCLKSHTTRKDSHSGTTSDKKNEIDDSKVVK